MGNVKRVAINQSWILPIAIGNEVLIEFAGTGSRQSGRFVGLEPGKYLIVNSELPPNMGTSAMPLQGAAMVVRYMHDGVVYGFKSSAILNLRLPSSLIFINYPEVLEEYPIRCAPRYECKLPAKVVLEGVEMDVMLVDISSGGGKYMLNHDDAKSVAALGFAPDQHKRATLKLTLPYLSGALELTGEVRHAMPAEGGMAFQGIKFDNSDGEAIKQLKIFLGNLAMFARHGSLVQEEGAAD